MCADGFLATTLGCDVADAHTMLRQIDNISTKLAIISELANRHPNKPASKAYLEHLPDIQTGLSLRNELGSGLN